MQNSVTSLLYQKHQHLSTMLTSNTIITTRDTPYRSSNRNERRLQLRRRASRTNHRTKILRQIAAGKSAGPRRLGSAAPDAEEISAQHRRSEAGQRLPGEGSSQGRHVGLPLPQPKPKGAAAHERCCGDVGSPSVASGG